MTSFSFAQGQSWLWAKSGSGGNTDVANSVATDAAGNVYVAGYFNSWPLIFGTDTLYTTGAYDMYLVKYDANGNALWARSIGGSGLPTYECDDRAYSVAVDTSGNVYVAGTFTSAFIVFGNDTLTKAGSNYTNQDVYVVKYDSAGNVLWARNGARGSGVDYAYSVATDVSGNVYVAGTYASDSITFGTTVITGGSLYLAKYDAAGNVVWASGSAGNFYGNVSIAVNTLGNVYLTGSYFGNSITLGSTTLTHTGGVGYHMCFVKYDTGGNIVWAKGENGNFDDYGYAVALDAFGNEYVVGAFLSNTIVFDTYTITNTAAAPAYDSFIIKYNANGNVQWAKGADASSAAVWPGSNDRPYSVTVDPSGNIYMAGAFLCTTLTFGSTVLNNATGPNGYSDIYVVKYNTNGNVLGALSTGGNSEDYAYSVTADDSGNVYVAGNFVSSTIPFGSDTLTGTGIQDAFLARLNGAVLSGIKSVNNKNNISVYPNPSDGLFTIGSMGSRFNVDVYTMLGEKVFQTANLIGQISIEINLPSSPGGMYFMKIYDGTEIVVLKITVQ
jgi:hypothetical protein